MIYAMLTTTRILLQEHIPDRSMKKISRDSWRLGNFARSIFGLRTKPSWHGCWKWVWLNYPTLSTIWHSLAFHIGGRLLEFRWASKADWWRRLGSWYWCWFFEKVHAVCSRLSSFPAAYLSFLGNSWRFLHSRSAAQVIEVYDFMLPTTIAGICPVETSQLPRQGNNAVQAIAAIEAGAGFELI
jgi:hypothetical protein